VRVAGTRICGAGVGTHTAMCAGVSWTCCGAGAGWQILCLGNCVLSQSTWT